MDPDYRSVGEVAAELGTDPRTITALFYRRRLDPDRCPVVGGRRLIPADYMPQVRRVLLSRRPDRRQTPQSESK